LVSSILNVGGVSGNKFNENHLLQIFIFTLIFSI